MGLDMYLKAKVFVGGQYDHLKVKGGIRFLSGHGESRKNVYFSAKEIAYVDIQIAYWRKANQIHKWFVETVQNDVDDCGDYDVSKEQLQELVQLCKAILNDEAKPDTLPTTSGFFFGSTDYDDYYMEDLKSTVEQIEKALNDPRFESAYFEYHSSW